MGPGLILPSPTPAGPGRGPRGPPGGQPRSGAARTAAPAPPGGSAPLAGLPLLPGTGRALPRARGQRAGASRGGAAGARSCRRLQSARRAGTGTSGAGAGTGVGAGRARSVPSGPALPFPAGRGAVPPKGRAAGGRAARCPPGTVRAPSQLLPSLPSALRQRQESLEKTSEGFSNSRRRDLSQRGKKRGKKEKRLAASISSLQTQRHKNTHSVQPGSANEAAPAGTPLRVVSESAAPVGEVARARLRQLLAPRPGPNPPLPNAAGD